MKLLYWLDEWQALTQQEQEIFALNEHVKEQLDSTFPKDSRSLQSTKRLLKFLLQNGALSPNTHI